MNNFNITVELCAEDRARLDSILDALRTQTPALHLVEEPKEEPKPVEPQPEHADPVEEKAPWDGPEEPAPKYTADDVRAKVQKLAAPAAGKRNAVKKIVEEYAPSVSLIPEDKYPEVMAKLTALEEA